jgi:hypothetical protein
MRMQQPLSRTRLVTAELRSAASLVRRAAHQVATRRDIKAGSGGRTQRSKLAKYVRQR